MKTPPIIRRPICWLYGHNFVPYYRKSDFTLIELYNGDKKVVQNFDKACCTRCRKIVPVTLGDMEDFVIGIFETK